LFTAKLSTTLCDQNLETPILGQAPNLKDERYQDVIEARENAFRLGEDAGLPRIPTR